MTQPEIRPAREADIPELARLVAALAAYEEALDERARFDWDSIRQAPEWMRAVLAREHHAVWVADAGGGHLGGHLWVRLRRRHEGERPSEIGYISQAFLEELPRTRPDETDARGGVRLVSCQGNRADHAERAASQLARRRSVASPGFFGMARGAHDAAEAARGVIPRSSPDFSISSDEALTYRHRAICAPDMFVSGRIGVAIFS
jgi:hypothetical protein